MFCPEGYYTLHEVADVFWERARFHLEDSDETKAQLKKEEQEAKDGNWTLRIDTGVSPDDEVEAYAKWLMLAFLEIYREEVRIALPTGGVARLESWVTCSDWSPFYLDAWGEPYQLHTFPTRRSERLHHQENFLLNIDEQSQTIDSLKSKDRAVQIGLKQVHGFPLCIRSTHFFLDSRLPQDIERKLELHLLGDMSSQEKAKADPLVDRIIELVRSKGTTKWPTKAILAPDYSNPFWHTLWTVASERAPELNMSQSGRPKGSKNRLSYR